MFNPENHFTVYMHVFPNDKVYVGITGSSLNDRFGHCGNSYKGQFVYRAIQKYGWENIEHITLATCLSQYEAEQMEKEYIQIYKSYQHEHGYNIDMGGSHAGRTSDESRRKMSESHKGKAQPQSWRDAMQKHWDNPKPRTSKFQRLGIDSSVYSLKCKPVLAFDAKTGDFVKEYPSAVNAAKILGLSDSHISSICNKTSNRSICGGYVWMFKSDYSEENLIDCMFRTYKSKQGILIGIFSCVDDSLICIAASLAEAANVVGVKNGTIKYMMDSAGARNDMYCVRVSEDEYRQYYSQSFSPKKKYVESIGGEPYASKRST